MRILAPELFIMLIMLHGRAASLAPKPPFKDLKLILTLAEQGLELAG